MVFSLPGTGVGAEVDWDADVAGDIGLARHLGVLIQGQGLTQIPGQFIQACKKSGAHGQRIVREELQRFVALGLAFHEGPYGRLEVRVDDLIPFPMTGYGAVQAPMPRS